jgi:hypothetical protein
MMPDLIWLGALALALTLSVGLFVSAKLEIGRMRRRADSDRDAWEAALEQHTRELEAVRAELRAAESRQPAWMPEPPAPAGLNVSKRNQALRMHRAGHTTEHIAECLGMPEGEVELLLKVQAIVLQHI